MKQKSHSGAKKRIKVTGTGKFRFQKAHKSHLMAHKSKRAKKLNKSGQAVNAADKRNMARLLPNY